MDRERNLENIPCIDDGGREPAAPTYLMERDWFSEANERRGDSHNESVYHFIRI